MAAELAKAAAGATSRRDGRDPTVVELFRGFLWLGLTGFGGVLPLARRMIVEQRRWLTATEFADLLAVCQFLPGGNILNLAAALGARFRGARGSVAALAGLLALPAVIVIALGVCYQAWEGNTEVRGAVLGLAAVATGLLAATSAKIIRALPRRWAPLTVAAVCCAAVAVLHCPLLVVLPIMVAVSLLLNRKASR
ncbi:chromate transporter [Kitasatospora mediocidica]|uniref:chromate transporter n=1 Tax=Kitasatospora mediocidica TaxID=58352 RepID=UPI0005619969|nr:chromate transporter [Kitasatospora mediocidica]